MKPPFDIVIVGGGVTGLCAALMLAQCDQAERLRLRLIDASPKPKLASADDYNLRVSAVSMGSVREFERLGAWDTIAGIRCCAYDHMRVWDESCDPDGSSTLRFDADEFAVPHLGYIVENKLLQHGLLDALDTSNVEIRFGTSLESLSSHGSRQELGLGDGDTWQTDLVIAADGGRSRVRELAGIESRRLSYLQTAFVTHLESERPHRSTAWQRFLREGPLGMLPLADGRLSIVWTTTSDKATHAAACPETELGELLTQASDGVLGQLQPAGPRGTFPLAAQHANQYVRHGLALIGDAAHTVHPLAGQGANLGIADAAMLVQVIDAALGAGEHPADRPVLRRYERARRGENAAMMHLMTGLNRLFASNSSVVGELRRLGMAAFNHSGPVRERIAGVAIGSVRAR